MMFYLLAAIIRFLTCMPDLADCDGSTHASVLAIPTNIKRRNVGRGSPDSVPHPARSSFSCVFKVVPHDHQVWPARIESWRNDALDFTHLVFHIVPRIQIQRFVHMYDYVERLL
jgi:hypothetical protein